VSVRHQSMHEPGGVPMTRFRFYEGSYPVGESHQHLCVPWLRTSAFRRPNDLSFDVAPSQRSVGSAACVSAHDENSASPQRPLPP
jgi:hypothetical protein